MNPPPDPSLPPTPKIRPAADNSNTAAAPTANPTSPPLILPDSPPVPAGKTSPLRQVVAFLLSACLGLFLAGGVVSLLDDSLILLFNLHLLTVVSGIVTFLSFLLLVLVYGLMGLTPLVPKRVVLPMIAFTAVGLLAVLPTVIYHRNWSLPLDWTLSLGQALIGLGMLCRLRGGLNFRWQIIEPGQLGSRAFSGRNLAVFALLNILVLPPAIIAYLAICAGLATSHFTDGFLTLRPGGLMMHSRKYVRDDGKTVLLFPMSHIAESEFYQAVSQSASSNSVVLLEGITDDQNLLTNGLSYKRAAKSLGLAEQHDDLSMRQGELVRADVDVQDFSPSTIAILNLIGLVYAQGLNPSTLMLLSQFAPPPDLERQLWTDILLKRNEHLLQELRDRLPESDNFVIPWGAIHMPGIAEGIQKSGFRLVESREYVSIRFGPKAVKVSSSGAATNSPNP